MLSKLRLATLQAHNTFRSLHHQHVLGVTPLPRVSPPFTNVPKPEELSGLLEPSAGLLDSALTRSYACCGGGSSKKNQPSNPQDKQQSSRNNPKTSKDNKSSSSSSSKKNKQNPKNRE